MSTHHMKTIHISYGGPDRRIRDATHFDLHTPGARGRLLVGCHKVGAKLGGIWGDRLRKAVQRLHSTT